MNTTADISNSADLIDIRDVIARVEELEDSITDELDGESQYNDDLEEIVREATCGECGFTWNDALISGKTPVPSGRCPVEDEHEDRAELKRLTDLLSECEDNGGDEQWRGDWYPVTLIRETYFKDYAQELAEDVGAIDPKASWPLSYIDWDAAAEALQMDYTAVEFDGVTYWTR